MKHYRWQVNWGLGAFIAGGWSLPAFAVEALPEPVVVEIADAVQVLSSSEDEIETPSPIAAPKLVAPELLPHPWCLWVSQV